MEQIKQLTNRKEDTIKDVEQRARNFFYESYPDLKWENASHWKREIFRQTARQHLLEESNERDYDER